MLKEPDFPEPQNEGKSYVCLEGGQYIVYLDPAAAGSLLYSLHWFYDQLPGEEISISSGPWKELPQRGQPIGYCEFNMVPNHVQKQQGKNIRKTVQSTARHKPHGVYRPEDDRLDYFVSPEEISVAYAMLKLALESSNRKEAPREVILFDTLIVRLVYPGPL